MVGAVSLQLQLFIIWSGKCLAGTCWLEVDTRGTRQNVSFAVDRIPTHLSSFRLDLHYGDCLFLVITLKAHPWGSLTFVRSLSAYYFSTILVTLYTRPNAFWNRAVSTGPIRMKEWHAFRSHIYEKFRELFLVSQSRPQNTALIHTCIFTCPDLFMGHDAP